MKFIYQDYQNEVYISVIQCALPKPPGWLISASVSNSCHGWNPGPNLEQ